MTYVPVQVRRVAEAICAEAGMNPNNWRHKIGAARAAMDVIDTETIVAAAAVLDDDVWALPRPARHHHILWAIDQVLPGRAIEAHVQGFITSHGRFVGREEAARIASTAGQAKQLAAPPDLYSEDLW